MKALFQALVTHYLTTDLADALNAFDADEVPQRTSLPYGVYSMPSDTANYTFTSTGESILIQVDLYAETNFEVCNLYNQCRAAFDDCELSVAGYQFLRMERTFSQKLKAGDAWRYIVEYRVELVS